MPNPYLYPPEFREADLTDLFGRLIQGNCISLVGIGTVGKTHLIEHFSGNVDAQKHLLGQLSNVQLSHDDFMFVLIDPNAMLDPKPKALGTDHDLPVAWPGFELIFRRLLEAVRKAEGASSEDKDSLYRVISKRYMGIHNRERLGPIMSFALLELAVTSIFEEIITKGGKDGRLVLVFDEFNKLLELPDSFFLNLRSLRDMFRYQLVYIVAARQEVNNLINPARLASLEPFTDLFQKPLYLGACQTEYDLETMFVYLQYRLQKADSPWTDRAKHQLFQVTGGHGGLMRTCFEFREVFQGSAKDETVALKLLQESSVVKECRIMLESFTAKEKSILETIAEAGSIPLNSYIDAITLRTLEDKQVIERKSDAFCAAPLILQLYLKGRKQGLFTEPDYPPTDLPK